MGVGRLRGRQERRWALGCPRPGDLGGLKGWARSSAASGALPSPPAGSWHSGALGQPSPPTPDPRSPRERGGLQALRPQREKKKNLPPATSPGVLAAARAVGGPVFLPVPGLREECVSWGDMPVSSEPGSASAEYVLKGRYSWSCIIDAATENVLDESIDPRPLSSVSTGGKHRKPIYRFHVSLSLH